VNLARSGVASQIDTFPDRENDVSAVKAIDGDTSGLIHVSVAHPKTRPNAWWKVVLPYPAFIGNIQIYNRVDYGPGRINGVRVYVDEELVGTVVYTAGQNQYSFSDIDRFGQVGL